MTMTGSHLSLDLTLADRVSAIAVLDGNLLLREDPRRILYLCKIAFDVPKILATNEKHFLISEDKTAFRE